MWGITGLGAAVAIIFATGCWAAAKTAQASGSRDPKAIVVDEVVGQCLVLLSTPLDPLHYLAGFLLFRIFDIWKPWPVCWANRHVAGGFGIMLDDLLAAVYAVPVFWVLQALGETYGVRS
jgi:phosphatidylglycerophosphatase A